ncbi:hypothetical protein BU17DRAFT_100219 [Hysterangium stoloniferum]|nr:hypothetical protein BU17DRAFT_100219 [Hysterangium stoloniferum]
MTPLTNFTGLPRGWGDEKLLVGPGNATYLLINPARLRRTIVGDGLTKRQCELLLNIGHEVMPKAKRPSVVLLPRHAESLVKDILDRLEIFLLVESTADKIFGSFRKLFAWNANDFELIAVMYREDVENLLGFLFQNGALIPSRSKPSKLVSEPKPSGIEGIHSSTPAKQQIK